MKSALLFVLLFALGLISTSSTRRDGLSIRPSHHAQQVKHRLEVVGRAAAVQQDDYHPIGGYPQRALASDFNEERYQATPRDKALRLLPLLRQADTVATGVLFFCLTWRILSLFDLVNESKIFICNWTNRVSLAVLFVLNVLGFVLNIMRAGAFKSRLKAILALNIFREWIEAVYNIVMLVSYSGDRALYQGRFFMNVWWSLLCLSYSRSRWVKSAVSSNIAKQFADVQREEARR
eukprot:gene7922-8740_t